MFIAPPRRVDFFPDKKKVLADSNTLSHQGPSFFERVFEPPHGAVNLSGLKLSHLRHGREIVEGRAIPLSLNN